MVGTDTRFRAIGGLTPITRLPGTNLYTAGHGSTVTQDAPARQHIGTAIVSLAPRSGLPSRPTITSGHSCSVTHTARAAQPEKQP